MAWCVLCHRGYRREPRHCRALAAGDEGGWSWGRAALQGPEGCWGAVFPPFTCNLGYELTGYLAEVD